MRRIVEGVLSFYLFGFICLVFLCLSGGKVRGLDPLPPPIATDPLPPPLSPPPENGRKIGERDYWPGFGWVEWKGTYWLKIDAAPGVAAPPTFRGGTHHAGHNCPSCGRAQYVVSGFNRNGTHNHTCASCGTTWNH